MVFQSYFSSDVFYVRIRVLDIVSCLKYEKKFLVFVVVDDGDGYGYEGDGHIYSAHVLTATNSSGALAV